MDILEAPDGAVRALPDYPFASHYAAVPREPGAAETLRVHYIDEGPRDGRPVVFLHGGPGAGTSRRSSSWRIASA